jgi:CDP-paratose 2-epimerase
MRARLQSEFSQYHHSAIDIRDRDAVLAIVREQRPGLIVHAAAQTSHDRAAQIPFEDFEVNAVGTLHLLEAARQFCPESPFVFMSTNKVYGDRPNTLPLVELESRWEFAREDLQLGINEAFPIDQSTHSLFGVSKCQSGVELHGFLSYLVKCNLEGREYSVFGYKGKQVRDNIHSEDVAAFILEFCQAPRVGAVYNLGGGRDNSCSILEAFDLAESITGRKMVWTYVDRNRVGDHICYYTDLRKIQADYPNWKITKKLPDVISEIALGWKSSRC